MNAEVTVNNLIERTKKFEKINSLEELNKEVLCLGKSLKAKNYAFCVFSVAPSEKEDIKIFGHLGAALSCLVKDEKLIKKYCQIEIKPLNLSKITQFSKVYDPIKTKAFKTFNDTLIIPFKGLRYEFGCLILKSSSKTLLNEEYFKSIVRVQYMYDAYKKSNQSLKKDITFTKREVECLQWATEGKTSWEISQILAIADRTVNYHIGNCIRKTNSANRQQAIAKFYAMGIL